MSDFNETWSPCTFSLKIVRYQFQWKSLQWKPSSSISDGRTDMTKLAIALSNFANATNDWNVIQKVFVCYATLFQFVRRIRSINSTERCIVHGIVGLICGCSWLCFFVIIYIFFFGYMVEYVVLLRHFWCIETSAKMNDPFHFAGL